MVGYILILLVILLGGINAEIFNSSLKKKKNFVIIVFGMMILFAVLRDYSVGIDYANRLVSMRQIFSLGFTGIRNYMENIHQEEYLYTTYVWIVSRLIPSPWFINSVMDVFVLSTFGWFFYRYSKDVTIASLMFAAFAFTASLNVTRQYVATAFFLIALHLMIQKKPKRAIIPLIAASLIHTSALLLFAFYVVYWMGFSINRKKLFVFLATAVIAFFSFDVLLDIFVNVFPQFAYAIKGWGVGEGSFSVLWFGLYSILFLTLFFTLPKKQDGISDSVTGVVSLSFVLYALLGMLMSVLWFVHRMQVYFIFGYCMIIPIIIEQFPIEEKSKKAVSIIFKLGLSVWAILMFMQDGHGILPYKFIWD